MSRRCCLSLAGCSCYRNGDEPALPGCSDALCFVKACLSELLWISTSELVLLRHIQQAGAKVYTETEVMGIAGNVGAVAGGCHEPSPDDSARQLVAVLHRYEMYTLAERCTLPMMYERDQGIFVNNQLRTNIARYLRRGGMLPRSMKSTDWGPSDQGTMVFGSRTGC